MTYESLDVEVRSRSNGRLTMADTVTGYLEDVRHAAGIMQVEFDAANVDQQRAVVELAMTGVPDVRVNWSPYLGWCFAGGDGVWLYRVGVESDAASLVPDPDEVAGWLRVLAAGERTGHHDPPTPLDPHDEALIDRLLTFGTGADPYSM